MKRSRKRNWTGNKARRCSRKALVHALNDARIVKEGALNNEQAIKKSVNATDLVLIQAHICSSEHRGAGSNMIFCFDLCLEGASWTCLRVALICCGLYN